nr:hypothetical protein [Streptomyces sp. Termitarium-T10T-6]
MHGDTELLAFGERVDPAGLGVQGNGGVLELSEDLPLLGPLGEDGAVCVEGGL